MAGTVTIGFIMAFKYGRIYSSTTTGEWSFGCISPNAGRVDDLALIVEARGYFRIDRISCGMLITIMISKPEPPQSICML